jgi:alkanesulfonate monooxygenase SsuD/methylene tetrahydromethanopterin reductase-like flavin-dependent oxidoreductase (luciferase family)
LSYSSSTHDGSTNGCAGIRVRGLTPVDEFGQPLDGDIVIRNTIKEAVLADSVGIDSVNISEHYRPDLMDSAGRVMLAAIAGRTERSAPLSRY